MTLDSLTKESINKELEILDNVVLSIEQQVEQTSKRLAVEEQRAKELTQAIMHTQRDEDKALIASDEAVSHGLRDQRKTALEILIAQKKKPYFARIELEEEDLDTGKIRNIEYKLGFHANPDCRIVDWKKAPISKLYYEYKQGDEYSEEILGKERYGKISERVRVEIENSKLVSIQNANGTFSWNKQTLEWEASSGNRSSSTSNAGQIPDILSLITAEQYRAITEEAKTAILIQGVAGSGKTTVALYRLAWMLDSTNSDYKPEEITFLTLSPTLKLYIQNSLPALSITDVKINTYHEWAAKTIKFASGNSNFTMARPIDSCPASIDRVKRSVAILKTIEEYVEFRKDNLSFKNSLNDLQEILLSILKDYPNILKNDETKLLDKEVIQLALERTKRNYQESLYDFNDDALLLRIFQILTGGRVLSANNSLEHFKHIFVDEVQDLSPVELATIISSVKNVSDITLVGDTSQNIDDSQSFPGWEKLQKHWKLDPQSTKFVQLMVSFRSTEQIMNLAQYIKDSSFKINLNRDPKLPIPKQGRKPIWFKCKTEDAGIEASIKWLSKATQMFPNSLTAVLCANPIEAKNAYKMLSNSFGPLIRLGDAYSFSFEEGIIVTDIKQIKGLEFLSVLLWNPSKINIPSNTLGQNLLYVAVTRAQENLSIVTWSKPHPAMPQFARSELIRSIDLTIEETEEKIEKEDN
jgi:DNA helicase-2/ATP-dependent DNA helicase PcrA